MEHLPSWVPLVAGFLLTLVPSDRVSGTIRKLDSIAERATQAARAVAAGQPTSRKVR